MLDERPRWFTVEAKLGGWKIVGRLEGLTALLALREPSRLLFLELSFQLVEFELARRPT